jgi:hypothetical protein
VTAHGVIARLVRGGTRLRLVVLGTAEVIQVELLPGDAPSGRPADGIRAEVPRA